MAVAGLKSKIHRSITQANGRRKLGFLGPPITFAFRKFFSTKHFRLWYLCQDIAFYLVRCCYFCDLALGHPVPVPLPD
jgi:hypothetical protein